MSQIIVKVQAITSIEPHPNADRLEIANIGAWSTCVKKGVFTEGDLVVFIPPDAILPKALHEHLGITQYCGEMPKSSEEAKQESRRVRATRLRGVKSFGTLMTLQDVAEYCQWHENDIGCLQPDVDVSKWLGITKYTPPEKVVGGDIAPDHAMFHKYTDIERYQNFPDVFEEEEFVVITEKIHGTNCRVGLVLTDTGWQWMAGSHNTRRKQFDANGKTSLYWKPLCDNAKLCNMIEKIADGDKAVAVIVFGEIFGPGIQDMQYDGKVGFRVFDISVNGEYLDWDNLVEHCKEFEVEIVPVLYDGVFTKEALMEHTDGKTTVCTEVVSKFKGREGGVVKPVKERTSPDLPRGRVILKSVSVVYLNRKGATDNA